VQVSLSIAHWRMLRKGLGKKRFEFEQLREMQRQDRKVFDWLVDNGFFAAVDGEKYQVTDKGKASADQGFYEWTPPPAATPKKGRNRKPKGRSA